MLPSIRAGLGLLCEQPQTACGGEAKMKFEGGSFCALARTATVFGKAHGIVCTLAAMLAGCLVQLRRSSSCAEVRQRRSWFLEMECRLDFSGLNRDADVPEL